MENEFDDLEEKLKKKNKFNWLIDKMKKDKYIKDLMALDEFSDNFRLITTPFWNEDTKIGRLLKDTDEYMVHAHMSKNGCEVSLNYIREAIRIIAMQNKFHPVKDYLKKTEWDFKKRIDTWLIKSCGVEDNAYTRAVGRKTLCAAVARIMEPGIKFDHLLILEGKQHIGKSALVKILGGEFYGTTVLTYKDKDIISDMRGKWILEIEELTNINKWEIDKIKAFLSRSSDHIRLAYRYNSEEYPRQSIFIGTFNPSGAKYLIDTTGNRRFWPVECKYIDLEWVCANRDQLFAEALVKWKAGEDLYLKETEEIILSQAVQEERQAEDPWMKKIDDYLTPLVEKITNYEIATQCLGLQAGHVDMKHCVRIGIIMKQLGWESRKTTKKRITTYFNPDI